MQNVILEALAPHFTADQLDAHDDGSVWVQIADRWAHVEPMEKTLRSAKQAASFTITTGYEAGYDLAGGEKIEPKVGYVGGVKFGLIPHVLRWVKY